MNKGEICLFKLENLLRKKDLRACVDQSQCPVSQSIRWVVRPNPRSVVVSFFFGVLASLILAGSRLPLDLPRYTQERK